MPETEFDPTKRPEGTLPGMDASGWPEEDPDLMLDAAGEYVLPETASDAEASDAAEAAASKAWANPETVGQIISDAEVVANVVQLEVQDRSNGAEDVEVNAA